MFNFIVWQFKLLSEGQFATVQGSGNPWATSGQSPKNHVFAKTQNGCHKFGFALKFIDQKWKVANFCEPLEASEINNGCVMAIVFLFCPNSAVLGCYLWAEGSKPLDMFWSFSSSTSLTILKAYLIEISASSDVSASSQSLKPCWAESSPPPPPPPPWEWQLTLHPGSDRVK